MADNCDDVTEWGELGLHLAVLCPDKFEELLAAMRKIVDAQRTIAKFDWQLLFGRRPTKRYLA